MVIYISWGTNWLLHIICVFRHANPSERSAQMHRGWYAWITTVCYWSLLLIEKQLNEHLPRRHTMHQGVPADKCSCGLTRGKIRDWWTPESSQGGIDLLIPSLDKGCENNDALNAALASILGNWAGKAMQGREFRTGLEVKKWICGLISLVRKRHQPDPTQPQEEAFSSNTYVNLFMSRRSTINWRPLCPHKSSCPEEYLQTKIVKKMSIFTSEFLNTCLPPAPAVKARRVLLCSLWSTLCPSFFTRWAQSLTTDAPLWRLSEAQQKWAQRQFAVSSLFICAAHEEQGRVSNMEGGVHM